MHGQGMARFGAHLDFTGGEGGAGQNNDRDPPHRLCQYVTCIDSNYRAQHTNIAAKRTKSRVDLTGQIRPSL